MLNNVNSNPGTLWTSVNNNTSGNSQGGSFPKPVVNNNAGRHIQLDGNALVSAGVRLPGGGWVNASVFKAEGFSSDNPVMLVRGTDVDGRPFEEIININNVDPREASFIEMFALDGYFAANGKPTGVTRAVASLAGDEALGGNAFTKFDFVSPLLQLLETQRVNGNWDAFFQLNPIVDTLMNHIGNR